MNLPDFQPMSPDEMQRMMQFLLNQQAQFDAGLEKLSAKTDSIADGVIGLTGIVGQLVVAQLRTDEQLRELQSQVRATDTHVNDVESHLDVVIDMFERPGPNQLREDHWQRPSQNVLAFPDDGKRHEIIDGEHYVKSARRVDDAVVATGNHDYPD